MDETRTRVDWLNERLEMLVLDPIEEAPRPKRGVVGVDGTEDSRPAAAWAARLTNVVDLVYAEARGYPGEGAAPEAMEGLARDARFAMNLVEDDLASVSVKEHTLDAFPARALVEVAEATRADLILTSPRHWAGGQGREMGTVSETLIHHAPFPVLLAREDPSDGPVVLALGEDRSSRHAAAWACLLADVLACDLVVGHAAPEDLERLELDAFADDGDGYRARLLGWPAQPELLSLVDAEDPSLLVVGHGRSHDWLGSTALSMLRQAPCPVLVVPQPTLLEAA